VTARALPEARSDADLIRAVLAGARGDFEILVRRHNQRLFRAARAVCRSNEDAEDVVQQTWLRVFGSLAGFRGDAAFATWATRIAVREAIAAARRRPIVAEVPDAPSDDPAPDDHVERAQLARLLERCLDELPQGNREVIVLRDLVDLDTAETAACLGVSEEAVRVRLHRARAALAASVMERVTGDAREIYRFDGARCDRITANVMLAIARG
jgi:RNA polymerase sigma-70 factor (ECF subfamily)